jgi:hypothetical protein
MVPRGDSAGKVSLEPSPDYWQVTCRGRYDAPELLVALAEALPPGLTLYLEGTSISPIVAAYLDARAAPHPSAVATSIIWPRPKAYHMPITPEHVAGLADLMGNLAAVEVGDHLHAYRGTTAYLIWFDAWFDSPLYLRKDVPEDAVRRLSSAFGCDYSSFTAAP